MNEKITSYEQVPKSEIANRHSLISNLLSRYSHERSECQSNARSPFEYRIPHIAYLALLLLTFPSRGPAQTDTLSAAQDYQDQLIEDVIANEGEDSDEFTFNAAFALLEGYRRRPLDLNKATLEQLSETFLLSGPQIDRLFAYRDRMGGFISIYELQAVPGLDLETINRLRPFVQVGGGLDDATVGLGRMLSEGSRELFLRASRRLETARGYELGPDDATNFYLGDPYRLYAKYRQRYGNQLSFGVVMEKDPGEPLFRESNRNRGFDFYSAHFFLKNINRRFKAIALGDFTVSFGQGLILYTGFGFGKSSYSTNVARTSETLRPYASVNEFSFMRGAGVTIGLTDQLELTVFGSRRGRNANIIEATDTLDGIDPDFLAVSSLNLSGFNRTPAEVADRNAITQISYGGSLQFRPSQRLKLGFNFLGENLSRPLERNPQAYSRFFFSGTDLQNASLDYRYRYRNFTFFGELAHSLGSGTAMLHALQLGVDRDVDVAIVYRRYERDYQALNAFPFGETSGGRNEEGLYFGLEVRPNIHWRLNAYYDLWSNPWLRFNVDGPSGGREYRFRLTYTQKRKLNAYLEVRSETKGFGTDGDEREFTNLDPVVNRTRFQGRLHFGYKITKALEWRSRIDAGFTEDELNGRQEGFMLYQDFHYRPLGPLSFSARFAVFDTDGFDVRFYQYENGLTYNAFVLPYYNQGTRTFLLLRYKGIRGLTFEGRIAQTFFSDGTTFGSGLEATDKSRRTELGTQVIYRF